HHLTSKDHHCLGGRLTRKSTVAPRGCGVEPQQGIDKNMDKTKMMRFLVNLELTRKKDSILTKAMIQGATLDNLQEWLDGTGRWDRQGVPHERRRWRQKA
ncbi:unnamed protein product, partial [Ectocarpus sp. 12 AP-2014]